MAKAYYSEYVNHCLKFYARTPKPEFTDDVSKRNWESCRKVLDNDFASKDKEVLLEIYRRRDTVADNVYTVSQDFGISQGKIWKLIQKLEKRVALECGLVWEREVMYERGTTFR